MSYADATAFAASLATTLMVVIVVFQAGDGTHGAMPADEFDGDEDEFDGDGGVRGQEGEAFEQAFDANSPPISRMW